MSNQSRIGIKFIDTQMQKQQQELQAALQKSIQVSQKTGMQGEPLPYTLCSDNIINGTVILCFLFLTYALKNCKNTWHNTSKAYLPIRNGPVCSMR